MGLQTVIPTDVYVKGSLTADTNTPSSGSVTDAKVAAYAGTGTAIQAAKVQFRSNKTYSQESGTNAATEKHVLHIVIGTNAAVNSFKAGAVTVLTGDDACTVDLKKNGTSVLSAAIALASGDSNRVAKAGTVSVAAAVAGDCFEVIVTATHNSGALPKGVFASMDITEDPA